MKSRWRVIVVVGLLVAAAPGVAAIADGYMTGSASVPDVWVRSMTMPEKEAAANSIVSYPLAFRRALLDALTPEAKANVWRGVAERYRAEHALTGEQQAVIAEIIALAVPSTFSVPSGPQSLAALKTVAADTRRIIGEAGASELFRLTSRDEGSIGSLPLGVRLRYYVRSAAQLMDGAVTAVVAAMGGDCDCYTDFGQEHPQENNPDCTSNLPLCSVLQGCTFHYVGCGDWYLDPCNGRCIQKIPET